MVTCAADRPAHKFVTGMLFTDIWQRAAVPPSWRFASAGNGARLLICIEGQCSICLPILEHVTLIAAGEDRTHDLRIMRPTRCQLRYCRPCRLCATDYYTQQCKVWFSAQLTGELANMSRGGDRSQLLPRDLILCHSARAIIHDLSLIHI